MKNESVEQFLEKLNHPMRAEIDMLRKIIFESVENLSEHIKWNAPSFCCNGDDRITFNFPPKKDAILIVFHCGAKTKIKLEKPLIENDFGLLEWKGNDRAILKIKSKDDILNHQKSIENMVKNWILNSF